MIRVKRKRTKGWKTPENTINVTRPGKYGNPFKVGEPGVPTAEAAVRKYWEWITVTSEGKQLAAMAKLELRGKNLMCYCDLDKPCHADILLEVANSCY